MSSAGSSRSTGSAPGKKSPPGMAFISWSGRTWSADPPAGRPPMRADAMSAEEEAGLVKRAKAGDARATDNLVRANMWLCRLRASALKGYGIPMDDMIQQGAIGILKAVQRFDPTHGARFGTFAMQWIRSETTAYATSKAWLVKGLSTGSQRKVFF